MFMFRRRRTNNLTRKLLRKRRAVLNGPSVLERAPMEFSSDNKERDVQELLKKLQDTQLEMLLTAVDTRGLELGHCVLVRKNHLYDEPHLLFCQFWRWPEVQESNELHRLPQCNAAEDLIYTCCNPFHWSRLCQPETPPPPYTRTNEDRIRPEDRAPSELPLLTRNNSNESLTTSGESEFLNPLIWCKLAYWELHERVGPLFPVEPNYVNIFGDVPYGLDGFSLEALNHHGNKSPQAEISRKTRSKIGLGVTLSRESDGFIWLYNRSEMPIFVDSLYLKGGFHHHHHHHDLYGNWPTRVPPDHCLIVHVAEGLQNFLWNQFSLTQQQEQQHNRRESFHKGPADDPNSIRISFVKGWGSKYSRRDIIQCPCWMEILLSPCR